MFYLADLFFLQGINSQSLAASNTAFLQILQVDLLMMSWENGSLHTAKIDEIILLSRAKEHFALYRDLALLLPQ